MKKLAVATLILASVSNVVFAQGLNEKLAKTEVNHLQLLANNMNMFMLTKMESMKEKSQSNGDEFVKEFFKAHTDTENNLVFNAYYSAPVASLSKDKCQEKLLSDIEGLSGDSGVRAFQAVSYFQLSSSEVSAILESAKYSVTIIAKENNELKISCSK
ncbi:TPA: hypothetical protein RQL13_004447 [Vibrio vulnificus]|nr:hypothetical protein [Vibrio vulnificus]HAT8488874.1 hypothetical protein [Vibrio vulnificus]HAT8516361.1 hypothetical protein [Vibrio vulnificus]HAT8549551.1 hypothetical protein [Vibrio vulnificus]HDY8202033.1 hypothetical protein [Vibrio vulnificus]